MAAIQNITEDWQQHSGQEVQDYIKSLFISQGQQISDVTLGKIGYLVKVYTIVEGVEKPFLLAFATEADYTAWNANNDDPDHQPIINIELPMGGGGGVTPTAYFVELDLVRPDDTVMLGSDVTVLVKGTSVITRSSGTTSPINETLTLSIRTKVGVNGTWVTRQSVSIPANNNSYTTVHLGDYLSAGVNYVELIATGRYASSLVEEFMITVASLRLEPNTTFQRPFTDRLQFNYLYSCNVASVLQFEFGIGLDDNTFAATYSYDDSNQSAYWSECARNLSAGGNTVEGVEFGFTNAARVAALLQPGIHTVRARLWVSGSIHTDWIYSQYFVADSSPHVIINNIQKNLANWSNVYFFDWALCSPTEPLSVVFKLVNSSDHTQEYAGARWEFDANNGVMYPFSTQLAIENVSGDIYATMLVYDGTETTLLADEIPFVFSNNADFQPVPGADFILQPANRSNEETHPDTIRNEVNGNIISQGSGAFVGFDFKTDGWMSVKRDLSNDNDETTYRALHVPAGRKLNIDYNPFSEFLNGDSTGESMTLEVDFRASNILDDEEPLLSIAGTHGDGKAWGFVMLPTEAYLMTYNKRTRDDQNVSWAEDTRMHIAVNVVHNLGGLNYVRIFVNGVIDREFNYAVDDNFTAPNVKMVLGADNSDLDIFGIRCYKDRLGTDSVMKNYKASLATVAEKVKFQTDNNIIVGSEINFADCLGKYNVLGYTGPLPKWSPSGANPTHKGTNGEVSPSLYINIVGDEAHSGTLTNLEVKGQGTTAMTYFDWNQSYKITDNTEFLDADGNPKQETGKGYAIMNDEYKAKKLVGKINFASSMQSHKLGLTWIYTEVYKDLVSRNVMSNPGQFINNGDDIQNFPNARLSVFEKPFLFFHRETENDAYEFRYLMTWGAGKGDKPTFGYDKNKTANMLMVEGANNDRPLALFMIPWNEDVSYVTKAEDPDNGEAWHYNGMKQINFGFGKTSGDGDAEYPSNDTAINAIKDFFNFAYLHNTRIEPYIGSYGGLRDNVTGSSTSAMRWVTQETSTGDGTQYNLYRWSDIDGRWVDAGINKLGAGQYQVLNMRSQYESFCQNAGISPVSWSGLTPAQINAEIIKARRLDFMVNGPARQVGGVWTGYFHLNDALYHSCFVKFFAGTDNRAKNTYYYTDPVSLRIRWMQDDLDTTLKTNNVGQNRKPYYVEEHDTNAGEYYWQGESNGFYNLLEECYTPNSTLGSYSNDRMAGIMKQMLTTMSSKGNGDVMNYMLNRLLYVQDYFPAIAYNEQARKVYEVAAVAQSRGEYTNASAQAITQSCGSQRWSEYQWLKDRIMYISSWCEFGEFASGGLGWRGTRLELPSLDYNFKLTPAKWMYPRIGHDSGNYSPTGVDMGRVRVQKGHELAYATITLTSDSYLAIRGINHLLKIGDMNVGVSRSQGDFSFMGKKLQEVTINPEWDATNNNITNYFMASGILINGATNIKQFIARNVSNATGELDLSKCVRLELIDLKGSAFASVVKLPKTGSLTEVQLPAGLTSLIIEDCPNLATVELEGYASLTEIVVRRAPNVPSLTVVTQAINNNAQLNRVILEGVNWQNVAPSALVKLAEVHATLTGTVSLSGAPTLAQKLALVAEYGNVDNPNNPLYITGYTPVEIASISISGEKRTPTNGDYQYTLNTNPTNGNNVTGIHWSISENSFATIDPDTGLLHVTGNPVYNGNDYAIITCEITVGTGTAPEPATFQVGFFERKAQVGDLVYHDGTFGPKSERDANKTVVGVCFYSNDIEDGEGNIIFHDRRMISMNQIGPSGSYVWGPYNNASNGIAGFSNIQGVGSVYNVGNIPDIKNSNNWTVNRANYWQGEWPEGQFRYGDSDDYAQGNIGARETGPSGLLDAPANSYIPVGRKYTLEMIALRNKILNSNIWSTIDSVEGYAGQATTAFGDVFTDDPDGTEGLVADTTGRKIPRDVGNRKEFAVVGSLFSKLNTLKDSSGTAQRYGHLLFQAASMCYAYEPSAVGLVNKFKAHNWYLPSAGEMCRIYWHMKSACDGNAPFSGIANCAALHSDYMWTSGEYDNSYAWFFNGSSGVLNGSISYSNKYTPRQCRAACAF